MEQGRPTDAGTHLPPAPRTASRVREWAVAILAAGLLLTVAIMQRPEGPDPAKVAEARTGATVEPVGLDPLVGIGKALLWWKWNRPDADPAVLPRIDELAHGAPAKFRMAILAGEFAGDGERETRLAKLLEQLAPESILRTDIETVRMLKDKEAARSPDPVALAGFNERHGWFARAALYGRDPHNPAGDAAFRDQATNHGARLLVVILVFGLGLCAALVAGVICLIILIVRAAGGNVRSGFVPTPPELGRDNALWLETFAVFLASFLLVHLIGAAIRNAAPAKAAWPTAALLLMQWTLVAAIFWPRLRGMSRERFLGELGWHRGRGIRREIAAGVMGYLAGLPVYFLMAILVAVASAIFEALRKIGSPPGSGAEDVPLPDNKVFDLIGSSRGWMLILLASLIVVWAPLVEESIFRGALYRHIRARLGGGWGLLASAGLVAAAFAIAHAYILAGVIMVATLGGIFALMREWRGSLIAPMTAHCLHNSMVLTLLVSLMPVMRG